MSEKLEIRCSSLPRLFACTGSLMAADGLASPGSALADVGTRIHADLARRVDALADAPELTDDEEAVADTLWGFAGQVFETDGEPTPDRGMAVETPLRLDRKSWTLTGRPDLVWCDRDGRVHILDYKTGYAAQDEADDSAQLLGYAALVFGDTANAREAILHMITRYGMSTSLCTRADADKLLEQVDAIVDVRAKALRVPSPDACRYCPAFGTKRCPESMEEPMGTINKITTLMKETGVVSPDFIKAYAPMLPLLKKAVEALEDGAKAMLESQPDAIEGVTLQPGATRKKLLISVQETYNYVSDVLTPEQFQEACAVSLPKLAKLVPDIEKRISYAIEVSRNAPSLKFAKKAK